MTRPNHSDDRPSDQSSKGEGMKKETLASSQPDDKKLASPKGNPDLHSLSFDSLQATIVDRHRRIVSLGNHILDYAREAGEALLEVKRRVGHGKWETWLDENCVEYSKRQACRYKAVAENWPEIKKRREKEGPLSLTDAVDKRKGKSVVHDRFGISAPEPSTSKAQNNVSEKVLRDPESVGILLEDGGSDENPDKERSSDDRPEAERLREIERLFATLLKTLLPAVREHFMEIHRLMYPKGAPERGGFPMRMADKATTDLIGIVRSWMPKGPCSHCDLKGCEHCDGQGWHRRRQS
jgi:hypothetical protein